jgi:hypothetical protein
VVVSFRASAWALTLALLLALAASAQPPAMLPEAAPGGEPTPNAQPATPAADAKAEEPKADPAAPAPKSTPVAGWDDMFYLRSPDRRFMLRFTGQVQADYRDVLNPGDDTDIDTFVVRRARIGLEATLFENYEFRFPARGRLPERRLLGRVPVHRR